MRRPQLVIDLTNGDAFGRFHAALSGMGCPDQQIGQAWDVVKKESSGEYNTATRTLRDPAFAHAVAAALSGCNAEPAPPRRHAPVRPGEFAIEFEHRRLEPDKVNLWFRAAT